MIRQTTTWTQINKRLEIFLNDDPLRVEEGEELTATYTERQRLLSWHDAQRLLVWHTPRQMVQSVVVDRDERSIVLPPDFISAWRVFDSYNNRWMTLMKAPVQGGVRSLDDENNLYWVWGGKMYFERELEIDQPNVTLYYWAYYPEVIYDLDAKGDVELQEDTIAVPPWAILPLCHLTAATCLEPGAIQAAEVRQWNIRVDSGTPIQNVRAQQAREHMWWWNTLLGAVPRPGAWIGE